MTLSVPMPTKRVVFSYPGVMQHAQQIALALHESHELHAFVTSFVFREDSLLTTLLKAGLGGRSEKVVRQLRRRSVSSVPASLVHGYPYWEMVRTGMSKLGASPRAIDAVWDLMAHRFDAVVAKRYVPHADVIHAFEYTALASFDHIQT